MTRPVTGYQLAIALLVFDAAALGTWPLLPAWLRHLWRAVAYLPLLLTCVLGIVWSGGLFAMVAIHARCRWSTPHSCWADLCRGGA